jgi:hypothetical protein
VLPAYADGMADFDKLLARMTWSEAYAILCTMEADRERFPKYYLSGMRARMCDTESRARKRIPRNKRVRIK